MLKKVMRYLGEGTLFYHIKIHFWRTRKLFKLYGIKARQNTIQANKIVFCNMGGLGYGGDPKYIAEYILENKLGYDLVWLVDSRLCRDTAAFPRDISLVEINSIRALFELSSAFAWIDNARKMIYTPKKKGQIYIQTWHGTFPTKKIEKDAEETLDPYYISVAKKDSEMIDYIVSGCALKTRIYKNSFYYDGIVLDIGTPKADIFFNEKKMQGNAEKVRKYYSIPVGNLVVLYAPTFRRNMGTDVYDLDYQKIAMAFEKRFHQKCTVLVRLHPNLALHAKSLELPQNVINATSYSDMQELLCAADFIISDYSSTLDYSIFDRPIFLYCPDLDEYRAHDREFYIGMEELPFSLAGTNEELEKNILDFHMEKYLDDLHAAYRRYGLFEDGHSCSRVMELIEQEQKQMACQYSRRK